MLLKFKQLVMACLVVGAAQSLGHASLALAAPAQVIIIRHAEKDPDTGNLTPRGWERAHALVQFFKTAPVVTKFGLPVAIYATGAKHADSAIRTIQTVTPLAKDLGQRLHKEFLKGDLSAVVDDIMNNPDYDGRMVLICWKHGEIPELAEEFGYSNPPSWSGSTFDRAWILSFNGSKVSSLDDIPQNILDGDSTR